MLDRNALFLSYCGLDAEVMMKKKDDFLSERENSDHSSDYSLEILYDDSFEDRASGDRSPKGDGRSKRRKKKKRLPMQRWKKIVLGVVATLLVIIIGKISL